MKWLLLGLAVGFVLLLGGCTVQDAKPKIINEQNLNEPDYSCQSDSDCVHTCGAGCANKEWAKSYKDPCQNVRGYDCSCVNNLCYSDGTPPPKKL